MESNQLITEARARISWGESPLAVRDFLTTNGIPAADARSKIKELYAERNWEIRKVNLKNIFIGVILAGVGGFFVYDSFHDSSTVRTIKGRGAELGIGLGIGCYGLYKSVNGIIYFFRPQLEDESLAEL